MMFRNLLATTLCCLALVSAPLYGEDMTFEEVMATFDGTVKARRDEGLIHSINYSNRTGIIGGHKYWFGQQFSEIPLKVKLLNSDTGAFELLEPGMKVSVTYGDSGRARVAVIVEQLAFDADIEH